jgi:hypothetical protein
VLRQLTNKFLHRVRIHGGEFDSSARAMNRAEGSNSLQAELRKFRGSTFERKQMSTTIKRVALVAVAALGLGVVSVAPSQAVSFSDSLVLSAATSTQLTSETATATSATATLTFLAQNVGDTMSVTASLVSAPAGNVALPQLLLTDTVSAEANAGGVLRNDATSGVDAGTAVKVYPYAITGATNVSAKFKVFLNAPSKVGTYVVKLTPAVVSGGGALNATAQTLTITVSQNPGTDTVATSATSIINAGETVSATADVTVTASKAASTTAAAATIKVSLKNAAAAAVSAESYTATISGPGILGSGTFTGTADNGGDAKGRAITVKNGDVVGVYADGTSGVSTVTISSAAGVVLATETLTFFGDAAKIVTTVKKAVIGGTDAVADVLSIVVTDAAGVSVSNLTTVNVVSSSVATIAGAYTSASATYSTTTGAYLVPLTPVAAGTANITVTTKSSATATTGVDAAAVSVRVGSRTPASVKVTTDKSSYAPGEKGSISVQLFDADGLELASGETYTAIFATGGIVASYALQNSDATTGTDVISYTAGGKLYTFYAPVTEGDVTFKYTTGSTASALKTGLATANQAAAGVVTISVSSAATSQAIDAANEAAQAASDATDAALAAADAADAATTKAQEAVDAVATLSAQVSKLITALKAQITTLTNLVIKIQKKVKA